MTNPFDRDVWAVLGMPIDNVTLDEAARLIERAVETRERLSFVTPNVNWLVRALKDPEAMRQIINADLSLADGAPIVWLARKLGVPLKERVAGSDLFDRLRTASAPEAVPIRVFFFGGRDGAAEAACNRLTAEQGRMIGAGWLNPGFGSVEAMSSDAVRAQINAARPDFVLVALGAAKGQAWIEKNQDHLEAPVIAHLGAVVDFVAGTVRRAPAWMSRIGLEWAWRIIAEPSLWTRYWSDGMALLGFITGRLKPLQRAAQGAAAPSPVSVQRRADDIRISGDVVHHNRAALRADLSRLCTADDVAAVDLCDVGAIDAAGFGQLRMLQHLQLRRGGDLRVQANTRLMPALKAANFI